MRTQVGNIDGERPSDVGVRQRPTPTVPYPGRISRLRKVCPFATWTAMTFGSQRPKIQQPTSLFDSVDHKLRSNYGLLAGPAALAAATHRRLDVVVTTSARESSPIT